MPANLDDHAGHADDGEQGAAADGADGQADDRDRQGQQSQPRHERHDEWNVAFAVETVGQHAQEHGQEDDGCGQPEQRGQRVHGRAATGHATLRAVEGAARAGRVEARAQVLDIVALVFRHAANHTRPPRTGVGRGREGSHCFYLNAARMSLCGHFPST